MILTGLFLYFSPFPPCLCFCSEPISGEKKNGSTAVAESVAR